MVFSEADHHSSVLEVEHDLKRNETSNKGNGRVMKEIEWETDGFVNNYGDISTPQFKRDENTKAKIATKFEHCVVPVRGIGNKESRTEQTENSN